MHSVIVLEKRNTLYSWVIILCLLTFILSVTGTFLVRSGILNSVHTFANDPSRGLYILIFLSLMIFSSLTIFFNRQKENASYNFSSNRKETFLLLNNWFMAFYLATVLIGTVYPIFTETLSDIKISVGPPFYNMVIIPIIAPFLLLMALAPKAKWIKNKFKSSTKVILTFLAAIFINILITYYFKSYSVLTNLIIISSIFLIIYSLLDLFNSFKKNNYDLSRIISHLGFGLLVFFIGINHTFTVEKDFNLKKGEVKNFENFNINFKSLKIEEEKNYKAVIGEFSITNKKDSSNQMLYPEIRIYKQPETLTYESSIKSKFSHDLYLTMSNINQSEFYNIKFQKKPFMLWIWMSAILISLGGFIRIFRNEN